MYGLLANSIVLYVIYNTRNLRAKCYHLIISVTIADVILCFFMFSIVGNFLYRTLNGDEEHDDGGTNIDCVIFTSFLSFFCALSSVLPLGIAIDRFWAVRFPISYHVKNSKNTGRKYTKWIVIICWIIAFINGILNFYILSSSHYDRYCMLISGQNRFFNLLTTISTFSIFVLFLVFVILVIHAIMKQASLEFFFFLINSISNFENFVKFQLRNRATMKSPTADASFRIAYQNTKTMLSVASIYVFCWMPLTMHTIFSEFSGKSHENASTFVYFAVGIKLLAFIIKTSLDPVFFAFRISEIGDAIKSAMSTGETSITRQSM